MEQMNYEFSLSSKRKVVVREPKIGDQEIAGQACAEKAGENTMLFAMMLQNELLKLLLISVDGKLLTGTEKEQLKNLFTNQEYQEILLGIGDVLGKPKKPQISMVKGDGTQSLG